MKDRRMLAVGVLVSGSALAQDPVPPVTPDPIPATPVPATPDPIPSGPPPATLADSQGFCQPGECCPPTTAQKLFIGVGDLGILVVTFLLFVRLMERRFINDGRSATMGRNVGISLSLFLTSLGMAALAYLVTGCWPPEFTLWVAFAGVVWALHGLYTLIVVRSN